MGSQNQLLLKGSTLGIVAGIGAEILKKPLGLDDRPVNKTRCTKLMTVVWYGIGGFVSAITFKRLTAEEE